MYIKSPSHSTPFHYLPGLFLDLPYDMLLVYLLLIKVGENNIGAPKTFKKNLSNCSFLFIAPCKIITLFLLCFISCISSFLLFGAIVISFPYSSLLPDSERKSNKYYCCNRWKNNNDKKNKRDTMNQCIVQIQKLKQQLLLLNGWMSANYILSKREKSNIAKVTFCILGASIFFLPIVMEIFSFEKM